MTARINAMAAILCGLMFTGCKSTHPYETRMCAVERAYVASDFDKAASMLEEGKGILDDGKPRYTEAGDPDGPNRNLYTLEQAVVHLAAGDPASAQEAARVGGDDLYATYETFAAETYDTLLGKFSWNDVGAWMFDDWALQYWGEDYEHVMTQTLGAMAALANDHTDVNPYVHRAAELTDQFRETARHYAEDPTLELRGTGAGYYLLGIVHEGDGRTADARQAFEAAGEIEGVALTEGIARRSESPQNDTGVAHVLILGGRAPKKVSVEDKDALLKLRLSELAVDIVEVILKRHEIRENPIELINSVIPPSMSFRVPALEPVPMDFAALRVMTPDGTVAVEAEAISDFEALAIHNFASQRDIVIRRTFIRKLIKGVLGELAGRGVQLALDDVDSDLGLAASVATKIAGWFWREAETADVRCWHLLPKALYAARLELPQGQHTIEVQTIDAAGIPVGPTRSIEIEVWAGEPSYVVGVVPDTKTATVLSTNRPVEPAAVVEPADLAEVVP